MKLATAATANGNYPTANGLLHQGGRLTVFASGTWDGATAKIQVKAPSGSVWIDTAASFSANGIAFLQLGPCAVRLNVAAGGESSQSLTVETS